MNKRKLKKWKPKSLLGKFKAFFRQKKPGEIIDEGMTLAGQAIDIGVQVAGDTIENLSETEVVQDGFKIVEGAIAGVQDTATGAYHNLKYSEANLNELETNIENQGGHYRWLNGKLQKADVVVIGGETLVTLLAASMISDEIENAYAAAYPNESQNFSFKEKVQELQEMDDGALTGFISGVKGKLFEQKYVKYLNDGNLPEGYEAVFAESTTQPGWDIAIKGSDGEIANVLQAKATDSVSYINDAIEKYPNIDVVTTEEVYSHLVMSSVNEGITNSAISNFDLVESVEDSVDAVDIPMDFSLPIFTLAFIAFTSYKDESLDKFMKLRTAGERSGKAYMSILVGTGVAAVTNTWWLGVLGSVGSRMLCDRGNLKKQVYEKLKETEQANQRIIDRMKQTLSDVAGV